MLMRKGKAVRVDNDNRTKNDWDDTDGKGGGKIIQCAIRCYMPMTHVLFLEVKVSRNSGSNTRIVTKWPITYSAAISLLHVKLLANTFGFASIAKTGKGSR